MMRRALITTALFCLSATLRAQTLFGVVLDPANRPISGVVAVLLDSTSNATARALSNEAGEFRLIAPRTGTYRIRTTRIGFGPFVSQAVILGTEGAASQRIVLNDTPILLDTVHSRGVSACRMTAGDSRSATWAVWEQARAALTAGELTAAARGVSATVIRYARTLELSHRHIIEQTAISGTEVVGPTWRSISADSLRRVGYVSEAGDSMSYLAPSLDVLSSDAFVEDHCFHLSVGDSSVLGIEFEPTRARRGVAEIRGTAWLDRSTSALRRLDFAYVNVSKDIDGEAGGSMDFVSMQNGAWAISRWNIRMPVFARVEGRNGFETRLAEYRVTGGELVAATSVASQGRDTLWARSPLVLTGTTVDSASNAPIGDATVSVAGTSTESHTDARGRFALPGVMPGSLLVRVRTRSLDSANAMKETPVIFADSMPPLTLRVPTSGQLASSLCGARPAGPGIIVGSATLRGDTMPNGNVTVSAIWSDPSSPMTEAQQLSHATNTRTDTNGSFTLCGLPLNTTVTLRAASPSASATPALVRIPTGRRFGRADLVLDVGRVAAGVLTGVVVNDSTLEPVAGAEVSLPQLAKTVLTNAKGEFRIIDIAPGQQHVRARHVGFGAVDTTLQFEADQLLRRTIRLSRVTILDSVLVHGAMRDPAMDDFEEHRHLGLGHFFTRDDLAKFEGRHLADVLRQTPGTGIVQGTGGQAWLTTSRGYKHRSDSVLTSDRTMGARPGCYARIYLDNMMVYASKNTGGVPSPLFDLNSIAPGSVEAIEYFAGPSEIPAKFMGLNTECGVLVIHTRR